jgi:hypothetical protein
MAGHRSRPTVWTVKADNGAAGDPSPSHRHSPRANPKHGSRPAPPRPVHTMGGPCIGIHVLGLGPESAKAAPSSSISTTSSSSGSESPSSTSCRCGIRSWGEAITRAGPSRTGHWIGRARGEPRRHPPVTLEPIREEEALPRPCEELLQLFVPASAACLSKGPGGSGPGRGPSVM